MRIISGSLKGRSIHPPKTFKARPTTDFAKENLFNILNNHFNFEEIKVLDLFGGTGSISYEFASRNCKEVVCLELNHNHYNFIKESAKSLQLNQIKVIKRDAFRFLKQNEEEFDLIFADPPYNIKNFEHIPDLIYSSKSLHSNTWVIIEHPNQLKFNQHSNFKEHRSYGGVNFSFFY